MTMPHDLDSFTPAYTPSFKYALDNELLLKAYVALIEKRLRAKRTARLLSLGIGHRIVSGRLLELMGEGVIDCYTLIEGSQKLIEDFRSRERPERGELELVHTWFESYEPAAPFDAIEMGFVLEHVEDPRSILARFGRFLTPGGALFVAVPNARSLHRLLGHTAGMLPDLYALSEYDHQLGHRRYFDAHSISKMVSEAGYRIVDTCGLVLKPLSTQQLLDLSLPREIWDSFTELGYQHPEITNGIYLEATR